MSNSHTTIVIWTTETEQNIEIVLLTKQIEIHSYRCLTLNNEKLLCQCACLLLGSCLKRECTCTRYVTACIKNQTKILEPDCVTFSCSRANGFFFHMNSANTNVAGEKLFLDLAIFCQSVLCACTQKSSKNSEYLRLAYYFNIWFIIF